MPESLKPVFSLSGREQSRPDIESQKSLARPARLERATSRSAARRRPQ
jgi:hypothetical protein